MKTNILLTLSFLLLLSCQEKSSKTNHKSTSSIHDEVDLSIENKKHATYQAKLIPLNGRLSGTISGSLNIIREDERVFFHVRLSGGPKEQIAHVQSIRNGSACPTESNDTNGDGFIDIIEGMPYFGDSIIPLDGDINSQKGGADYWPVNDPFGDYQYSEIASFDRFIEDLKARDNDLNDDLVKLNLNEELNLEGKVFVIHGIPNGPGIPASVATRGMYSAAQMLPIACGVIMKASNAPGVLDDGKGSWDIPEGMSGESVGGASGADDGAIMREPYPINTSGQGEAGEATPVRDNRIETQP